MKIILMGISALLLLAGCSNNQPVVQPVVQPADKEVANKEPAKTASNSNAKVPPLPVPEVDVNMDSAVEQATREVMTGDTVAYR